MTCMNKSKKCFQNNDFIYKGTRIKGEKRGENIDEKVFTHSRIVPFMHMYIGVNMYICLCACVCVCIKKRTKVLLES